MTELTLHSVAQEAHALITGEHAREIHEIYLHDTKNELVTIDKYIGFLHGLAAAGALEAVDFYELHDVLTAMRRRQNADSLNPPS